MANFIVTVVALFYIGNLGKPIPTFDHPGGYRGDTSGEGIVFPQPILSSRTGSGNCVHGFCDEVENYPIENINNAIKDLPDMMFNKLQGDPLELPSRLGPEDEAKPLCETIQITKYPKKAENSNNITKFIVNVPQKTQGIVLRTCVQKTETSQCGILPRFPDGYVSECTQKYSHVFLVTYDDETRTKTGYDTFVVPSCCVCVYKRPI